jgi:hypothetical protein
MLLFESSSSSRYAKSVNGKLQDDFIQGSQYKNFPSPELIQYSNTGKPHSKIHAVRFLAPSSMADKKKYRKTPLPPYSSSSTLKKKSLKKRRKTRKG